MTQEEKSYQEKLEKENELAYDADIPVMTHGENLVSLTFNPSGREDVLKIKKSISELIDFICKNRTTATTYGEKLKEELVHEAIMRLVDAQMWAVKALTF